jgi:hypothetical protein
MTAVSERPAFTLRFRNDRTHRALKLAAQELGVSMSELAERAIEHELARLADSLEDRFRRTVELLRSCEVQRGSDSYQAEIEAYAHAEVTEDDPLRARAVETRSSRN